MKPQSRIFALAVAVFAVLAVAPPAWAASIVVFPLDDGTMFKKGEGLRLTELITTKLNVLPEINVVRPAMLEMAAAEWNLRTVARLPGDKAGKVGAAAGANFAAYGKVTLDGRNLSVSGAVVDTESGAQAGTFKAKGRADKLDPLASQLASNILSAIGFPLAAADKREVFNARPTRNEAAYDAYIEGLTAMTAAKPDYEGAARAFRNAASEDGEFFKARVALGAALYYAGQDAEARKILDPLREASPSEPDPAYYAGMIQLRGGNEAGARAAFQKCTTYEKSPLLKYAASQAHLRRKELQDAAKELNDAIRLAPGSITMRLEIAKLFLLGKNPAEATRHLEAAVKLDGERAPAFKLLGDAHAERKNVQAAEDAYSRAIAIDPRYGEAYVEIGRLLAGAGQIDRAITKLKAATQVAKDSPHPWFALGRVYEQANKADAALQAYRKGLGIDPENALVQYRVGELSQDDPPYEEAVRAFEAVIRINPEILGAYTKLCQLYATREDFGRALRMCETAVQKTPKEADAHYAYGVALDNSGKSKEAIERLLRAVDLRPSFWHAHYQLAMAYERTGAQDKAVQHYRKAIEGNPKLQAAYFRLGMLAEARAAHAEAATWYEQAAGLENPGIDLLTRLARSHEAAGQFANAVQAYRRLTQAEPMNVEWRYLEAANLTRTNRTEEAAKAYIEIITNLEPRGARARIELGLIYLKAKRPGDAHKVLKDAAAVEPDNPGVHYGLARVHLEASADDGDLLDVDKGIEEAQHAVRLSGGRNATYLAALAEAHFADGDEDEAAEAIKKAIDIDPANLEYRKLLKKYRE